MNVQKEIDGANRRVRALVERRADEALVRLGFDPAKERRAALISGNEAQGYALGAAWRMLVDGMNAFAAGFRRGSSS